MKKSQTPPAARRQQLEDSVDAAHDWLVGGVSSGGGTQFHSTDQCQICGLERHYESDSQNGVPSHHTYNFRDKDLSLAEAAARGCS